MTRTSTASTLEPKRGALIRALALLAAAALLAVTLLPAAASAADRKKKGRTLSFEEDVVETTYLRPEGTVIEGINKKKRQSLIRIRIDFFAEIVRSAQDL